MSTSSPLKTVAPRRPTCHRRLRLAATAWLTLAIGGLAGCGGGGSGGENTSGTSSDTDSRYVAGLADNDTDSTLVIWNPALPSSTQQRYSGASALMLLNEQQFDAQAATVTQLGPARAFFLRQGALLTVDLRSGQTSHAAQTVTEAGTVCAIRSSQPLNPSATSAVLVLQSPADASDTSCQGTQRLLVWQASGAAQQMPLADESLASVLWRPDGTVAGLLTLRSVSGGGSWPSLRQVNTLSTVNWLGSPDNDTAIPSHYIGADPSHPGQGALQVAGQLRPLNWAGSEVSLGDSLATLVRTNSVAAAADSTGLYFADGAQILKFSGTQLQSLGTLDVNDNFAADGVDQLLLGTDHLFVRTQYISMNYTVQSLPKTAGGSPRQLTSLNITSYYDLPPSLAGVQGDTAVLISSSIYSRQLNRTATRFPADGSAALASETGYPLGEIWAPQRPWGASPKVNALFMVVDSHLQRWDLDSGLHADLVTVNALEPYNGTWWQTLDGQAAALGQINISTNRDLWSLQILPAPALTRITVEGQ